MCTLFLHEIRLPVAKSHRYNIEIRSPACRMAHGEPRCGEEETCVPGGGVSTERVKTLAFPTIATQIMILSFQETSCLIFVTPDSVCFSSKPDHCKFRRNRDCDLLGSCDVMRYDLTASHFFATFNLLPSVLMAVIKCTLFSTLLSILLQCDCKRK